MMDLRLSTSTISGLRSKSGNSETVTKLIKTVADQKSFKKRKVPHLFLMNFL